MNAQMKSVKTRNRIRLGATKRYQVQHVRSERQRDRDRTIALAGVSTRPAIPPGYCFCLAQKASTCFCRSRLASASACLTEDLPSTAAWKYGVEVGLPPCQKKC